VLPIEDFQPDGREGLASVRSGVEQDLKDAEVELKSLRLAHDNRRAEHDAHEAGFKTHLRNHVQRIQEIRTDGTDRGRQIRELQAESIAFEKRRVERDRLQEAYLVESARFNAQRAVLERRIDRFRARMSGIDDLIDFWDFDEIPPRASEVAVSEFEGPNTRERIRRVLSSQQTPMRMADIVRIVQSEGSKAREDSIRTVLAKMHESGQVARVERGFYQLVGESSDDEDG
jgi:hypothetical protein